LYDIRYYILCPIMVYATMIIIVIRRSIEIFIAALRQLRIKWCTAETEGLGSSRPNAQL
jgi:hypothetical protein